MVPPRGVALQLGTNFFMPLLYHQQRGAAGGDYPVQATVTDAPTTAPVFRSKAVLSGVLAPCVKVARGTGKYEGRVPRNRQQRQANSKGNWPQQSLPDAADRLPWPPALDHGGRSWEEPGNWVKASAVTRNAAGTPVSLTGCSKLKFPPEIGVKPDSSNASTSSGLTVNVHVPQTAALNPNGLAESSLRDTTLTLPEGVAINPSGGDGLEACSEGFGGL